MQITRKHNSVKNKMNKFLCTQWKSSILCIIILFILNLLIIFCLQVKEVVKKNTNSKIKPDFQQIDRIIAGKAL